MTKPKGATTYAPHRLVVKNAEDLHPSDEILLEDGGHLLILEARSNGIYANVAYRDVDGTTQTYAFQPNEKLCVKIFGKGEQ